MGAVRKDASEDVLAGEHHGLLGRMSHFLDVEAGFEVAVSAALGPAAEALAVRERSHSLEILKGLRESSGGRVHLVTAGLGLPAGAGNSVARPTGRRMSFRRPSHWPARSSTSLPTP